MRCREARGTGESVVDSIGFTADLFAVVLGGLTILTGCIAVLRRAQHPGLDVWDVVLIVSLVGAAAVLLFILGQGGKVSVI